MKIYQPMLFVGLGGTGNRIGAELERALRRELCGPDGTALTGGGRRDAFQLPDCLQFVYADFSEGELARLPHLSAKGAEAAAYIHTARAIHDIQPAGYRGSADVARMLRVDMPEETAGWLPPAEGQPLVAPLNTGAGQLPTVGRAALFATLRNGLEPVLRPLRQAIEAIATSAGDLREVGGRHINGCDVFVAFSVAGGTGAGIFYDFLHLIGHEFAMTFRQAIDGVKIYPLVVMPSAFPPGAGGGRAAELNAGRALVDISRLVDSQNAPDAPEDFGDVGGDGTPGVLYPGGGRITLRPATARTAILFGRTAGIQPEDLRRSITAIVMSLIGTELGDEGAPGNADGDYVTFAESFLNKSVERANPSPSGIGRRGLSTSLAASLTVPVDDLAEIVAGRLLAGAVRGMAETARRPAAGGTERVAGMFRDAGIGALWDREPRPVSLPDPLPRGSRAIGEALRDRLADMEDGLRRLKEDLDRVMPRLVEEFSPAAAARGLLGTLGPFALEGVFNGVKDHPERVAEAGFAAMLDNRRNQPERPEGVQFAPPPVPLISRRMGGLAPARWGAPVVQACLEDQDRWYQWRANRLWHEAWREHEFRWRPNLVRAQRNVEDLVGALRAHEKEEDRLSAESQRKLYRDDRKGVSYLLPPQAGLTAFYGAVFERLRQHAEQPEGGDEAGLLERLIERRDWQKALDQAARLSPQAAVTDVKHVIEGHVKRRFVEPGVVGDRPLLPSLAALLHAAAGDEKDAAAVDARWLTQLRAQLARLLPVGFTPDGKGPLKILVVHPRTEAVTRTERYLGTGLALPRDSAAAIEYRAVSTDSITVVLFRSEMSLTDVSEVNQVLRLWAGAREAASPEDALNWRQRLGYDDDWLASTEDDRQRILHHLLCAVWNGRAEVHGDAKSPSAVRIRLSEGGTATVTLRLDRLDDGVSSWTGLLSAYERYALLDEGQIIQVVLQQLMRAQPDGLMTKPVKPSPLYRLLVHEVAPQQLTLLDDLVRELGAESEPWLAPLRHFWGVTLPGALDLPFPGLNANQLRRTLRTLEQHQRRGGQAAEPPDEGSPSPDDEGRSDGGSSGEDEEEDW
jgi:tubulin-like protein